MRIHTAKMTGLKPNTEYAYQVEGGDKASFVAAPERDGGNVYAVLADFGYVNDVALSTLLEDASAGAFDSLIHAGGAYRISIGWSLLWHIQCEHF